MEIQYDDITLIIPPLNESLNIGKLSGIVTNSYPNISVIALMMAQKTKLALLSGVFI